MKALASALRIFGWIWLELWVVLMLVQIYDTWQEYPPLREQLQAPFIFNWLIAIAGFAAGIVALLSAGKIRNRAADCHSA